GGAGFIGRYVVQRLAKADWTVRVAGRDLTRAAQLKHLGVVGQVAPTLANIRDDASVAQAVDGADVVINLVGILFESGKNKFDAVQAEAPGRIARAAKAAGARAMVHVSAIGASDTSDAAYARTKAAGEAAVFAGFPEATVLRPSIVFGPEDNFFNQFAAMSTFAPFLPLIGGGHTRFQPVYVDDVAAAVMAAITQPDATGRTFELGGPRVYSFRELMEHVLAETGRKTGLLPLPFGAASIMGRFGELLPKPFLTRDQVTLLKSDNVCAENAPGLAALGIEAASVESVTPKYLWRFRRGGRWAFKREKV
ncbi:MAG: complex I NDUFA9 subunit family protein, partial [Pseudomonadota bacterium]